MALTKVEKRIRIKRRVRGKISGSAELPRLSVFKSNKEIYAQLVDDKSGKTLVAASSREKDLANEKGLKLKSPHLLVKRLLKKLSLQELVQLCLIEMVSCIMVE